MATIQTTKRSHPSSSPAREAKRHCPTTPDTCPVKFLILSDTHSHPLPAYPPIDVLLHCGDLTEDGSPSSIESAIRDLSAMPAELKLVIPGNHEIALDKTYYLSQGGTLSSHTHARSLVSGPSCLATQLGITFLEEGTHSFALQSGATFTIYASPFTPRYGASAFQYASGEDRFNPACVTPAWATNVATETSTIRPGVDIVMTHGPAQYILDRTGDGRSAGCEHLRRAIARTRPRLHCFGHVHCGYGAERIAYTNQEEEREGGGETQTGPGVREEKDSIVSMGREWVGENECRRRGFARLAPSAARAWRESEGVTLCVNAAMEGEGRLQRWGWVVEMDLPIKKK